MSTAERLFKDIEKAARKKDIDPEVQCFSPKDLGLKASDYGSFSDFCDPNETRSGKWNKNIILKVKEWRGSRPYKYSLLK